MDFKDRKPYKNILKGYAFFIKKSMAFYFLNSFGENNELF